MERYYGLSRYENRIIMKFLKTTIIFLRTQQAVLLLLILALLAQLPHTATVFHRISTTQSVSTIGGFALGTVYGWTLAYVAAISVELAVLMFVVRGRKWYSWGFAACSVLMNMFYYWKPAWSLWVFPLPIDFLAAILWSLILPVAIALYSHEIKHERDAEEQTQVDSTSTVPEFVLPIIPLNEQYNGNGFTAFTNDALDTIATALTPSSTAPSKKQQQQPAKTKAKAPAAPTAKPSRQQQIVNLKQAGKSNAEIAYTLGIAQATVRVAWKQYNDSMKERNSNGSNNHDSASRNGSASGNGFDTNPATQEQTGRETDSGARETDWQTPDAEGQEATADQFGLETRTHPVAA